jgi:hypothetical protein
MSIKSNRNNSRATLAVVLIVVGGLWLLRQLGIYVDFPYFDLDDFFRPFRNVLHNFWHFIFSWPMLLIIIGLIMLAGRRSYGGVVLIVIGGFFLLPKIFFMPGLSATLLLPIILIGIGVAIVVRII